MRPAWICDVETIDKDITTVESGLVLHQVNCVGVMGAGVAKAIRSKWPDVDRQYGVMCDAHGRSRALLGKIQVINVGEDLWVGNIFGQFKPDLSSQATSYDAVNEGLRRLEVWHRDHTRKLPIYVPYLMGCGLGGGAWAIYSAIIEYYLPGATACRFN